MTTPAAPASPRAVVIGSSLWLAAALAFGASGVFAQMRPPAPQIIILILAIFAIVMSVSVPAVRTWVDSIPLPGLVGLHAIRFVGAVFVVLAARGALSAAFAMRAGWGDIAAAVGAVLLLLSGSPRSALHRWAYLVWNTFGVLDLIVAVGTATIVALRGDTPGMEPLTHLPLVLVPILFVPFLFAAHVAIYRRLISPHDVR